MTQNDVVRAACRRGDLEALQRMFPDGPTEWRSSDGCSLLHQVVQTSHLHVLDWLLTFPLNMNETTFRGITPLMWTCIGREPAIVRRLLDHGADVHATSLLGRTALHNACAHSWMDGVAVLLEQGANPDARDRQGRLPEDDLPVFSPHRDTLCARLDAARHGCGLK
jgi:ankyrin repeat protein